MENNTHDAEKTFTQADVDRIVAERLSRERAKQPDFEAREKELIKRENALNARAKLIEKNLPESLSDLVAGAEDMDKAIDTLAEAMNYKKSWGMSHEGRKSALEDADNLRGAFGLD